MSYLSDAIEMAKMDMPALYRTKPKPNLAQRFIGALRPGPKPKQRELTYRGRVPLQITQMINSVGEYREDPISFDTLNKMRRHPVVKLGTIIKTAPILTALREVKLQCDDKTVAAFVKTAFVDAHLLTVAESAIVPSIVYGVSPHEKVWEIKKITAQFIDENGTERTAWDGDAMVYKKIKFVHPETIHRWMLQKDTQDFEGFEQKKAPGDKTKRVVEAWKSFVYVNRFLFGGLWGESDYSDIYAYWYYSEFFRALQADYLRFKAIPPMVAWAPSGVRTDRNGDDVDTMKYMGDLLLEAYDKLVIVLPFEIDENSREKKFQFEELRVGEHSEVYTRAIEELDVMILRGLVVPERTVTQNMAAVGSYNQAEAHAERMLDAAKMETDRFLKAVNEWLIPQLVEDNFGPDAPECKLIAPTVSEALKTKLHNIVITILQNDRDGFFRRQVAFADLLDFLNIPFTKIDESLFPIIQQEAPPQQEEAEPMDED